MRDLVQTVLSWGERDQIMSGALMLFCSAILIAFRRQAVAALYRHAKSLPELEESWWQLRFKPTEGRVRFVLWAIISAFLAIGVGSIAAGVS